MYKFHEVQLAHANVQLEAVMDDYMFPAYTSPKLRTKAISLGDGMLFSHWKNEWIRLES